MSDAIESRDLTDRTEDAMDLFALAFNRHMTSHNHVSNAAFHAWAAFQGKYVAVLRPVAGAPETKP